MKKILSLFLAIVMLVTSFCLASFDAFARTKYTDAPVIELNKSMDIEFMPNEEFKSDFVAKFVAPETRYYEFIMDSIITDDDTMIFISIVDNPSKENEYNGFSVADTFVDVYSKAPYGIAAKLTKGKTYYLTLNGFGETLYTSSLTAKKHSHNYERTTFAAGVTESLNDTFSGKVADCCKYCEYEKTIEKIYAPKTATLSKTAYSYDGKTKKPTVTIKDSKGNVINKSNYTVEYKNNVKVGKATATITFKGKRYDGSFTKTFVINPKLTKINEITSSKKSVTVKWNRVIGQCDGYQIKRSDDKNSKKNVKTYTVKGSRISSKTISGLKSNKRYYFRIRTYKIVDGKKYYSAWSGYKSVKTLR